MLELELRKLRDELDVLRLRQYVDRPLQHALRLLDGAAGHQRAQPRRPRTALPPRLLTRRLVRRVGERRVARAFVEVGDVEVEGLGIVRILERLLEGGGERGRVA